MYVNDNKDKAVLFAYTLNAGRGETFNRVRLQGPDPVKTYKTQEINVMPGSRRFGSESGRSYTGEFLMTIGLSIGSASPLTSTVYEISE